LHRPNDDWAFYLDDFDPEAYARGTTYEIEYHLDLPYDQMKRIAQLVNRLAGKECASVYTEEPEALGGLVQMGITPPSGIALLPGRADKSRVVKMNLP